jgi:hypothetical protein
MFLPTIKTLLPAMMCSNLEWSAHRISLLPKVQLNNASELHVKDYLFLDGSRKYSYHWQDAHGNCIIRWDNAPHHQAVGTFPFHKHLGEQETITESPPMCNVGTG